MTDAWQAERLAALREDLARRGLDGFVVPRADEHQGEYVPPHAERLAWLTGFTGSAGTAVVTAERAALFVDGRYTLQAAAETDPALYEHRHLLQEPPAQWLETALSKGQVLGVDPWLHTADGLARLRRACERAGAELRAVDGNPIDALWTGRPPPPRAPLAAHPLRFAGETAAAKRARLAAALAEGGLDAAILTCPESLAWLLNLRGGDVPFAPLPLGFAILHADAVGRVDLVLPLDKVGDALRDHLGDAVHLRPTEDLGRSLDALRGRVVRVDRTTCAAWIVDRLTVAGADVRPGDDPCALPRAIKNGAELDGARMAHRRDGVALVRFLAWLSEVAPGEGIDELAAAARLEVFRAAGEHFQGLSFPTIAGAGPHGAIVHYRVTEDSSRPLAAGELFLVDSGGQYLDGTTDVTRTVVVGAPPSGTPGAELRRRYTQVLKGHLALGGLRFPEGTTGSQIDVLARHALWADGVDYDHGTGHGVGSYLSVHEGPQRIAKTASSVALEPGMILSNEPGYYKAGAYGIRIENLIAVRRLDPQPAGAERTVLAFETLTLAPYDRRLIDLALLGDAERRAVDAYHARVREALAPALAQAGDDGAGRWLAAATAPLQA
jgi:Xaa-Pro aminopeptidase